MVVLCRSRHIECKSTAILSAVCTHRKSDDAHIAASSLLDHIRVLSCASCRTTNVVYKSRLGKVLYSSDMVLKSREEKVSSESHKSHDDTLKYYQFEENWRHLKPMIFVAEKIVRD